MTQKEAKVKKTANCTNKQHSRVEKKWEEEARKNNKNKLVKKKEGE